MTDRRGLATVLRLAGPLIQVACMATLFTVLGHGIRFRGLSIESVLYVGIGIGFGLVVVGIALSRRPARPVDEWDQPRDAA